MDREPIAPVAVAGNVACVTAYVRLDSQHRSHDEYVGHVNRLLALGLPTVCYLDPSAVGVMPGPSVTTVPWTLSQCWLRDRLDGVGIPPSRNFAKDTAAFHTVQHAKPQWIADAVTHTDAELLVWVDAGIFHLADLKRWHIDAFFKRVARAPRDRVSLASIWPVEALSSGVCGIDYQHPQWWIAGGVFVVPRQLAQWWYDEFRREVCDTIAKTGAISWEVNHMAALCRDYQERTALWLCEDHDHTLFDFHP